MVESRWAEPKPLDCHVGDFWDEYDNWLSNNRARETRRSKVKHWRKFLKTLEPECLSDVTCNELEELKRTWADEGRNPVSINAFLREMKAIYNDAKSLSLGRDGRTDAQRVPGISCGVLQLGRSDQPASTVPLWRSPQSEPERRHATGAPCSH